MFTEPTVLVLGAGASAPYGYPTGESLVSRILGSEGTQYQKLRETAGYSGDLMRAFVTDLRRACVASVDSFLETRNEYKDIGKFVMAQRLVHEENEDILLERHDSINNDYWYPRLLDIILRGRAPIGENKLSIVTFNYDRSLEHFLHTASMHRTNWSNEETAAQLSSIPIVHVHGSLGLLPWQGRDGRPYGNTDNLDAIQSAANSIKIVSDLVSDTDEFIKARSLLQTATYIFFLGFGYGEANMRRLDIKEILRPRHNPHHRTFGTTVGFTGSERQRLSKSYPGIEFDRDNRKIVEAMRTLDMFQNAASGHFDANAS